MSDSKWNPSIVTPDGEPVDIPRTMNRDDPHRDPQVLQDMYYKAGLSTYEIAAYLGVNRWAVTKAMEKHDMERREDENPGPKSDTGRPFTFNNPNDTPELDLNLNGESPFVCPECEVEYETRHAQHECIRAHARNRADELSESGVF